MEQLQTNRFKEQTDDILGETSGQTLQFEDGILVSAKINTYAKIKGYQIEAFQYMAKSWCFENMQISRSGAGLKIEFLELNKERLAALNS